MAQKMSVSLSGAGTKQAALSSLLPRVVRAQIALTEAFLDPMSTVDLHENTLFEG
jgi:hypothetical protein